ncbi:SIR2 family protein [Vibrio vulnificus]|uniref:SIR2 family protein n=1 Tax=Vibrio vulnificus TaxID=672 RepID=UPI004059356E
MELEKLCDEIPHKKRSIDELITYITTKSSKTATNYSLLLGAGASVTSGIKSGQDLVSEWRKDIFQRYNSTTPYKEEEASNYLSKQSWYDPSKEYSSLFEKKFDLASQRRRFVEQQVDAAFPSIGYAYLVSLANGENIYFDTIYTTNFDDLINESFYQFSHTRPLLCAHDSSVSSLTINSSRPKIIKLHGDYLYDDIKSTLRETETLESNIKKKLIEFSKEYGLIVVGYSGGDRSIMDVISHLLKNEEYFKNGIYWCIRKGDNISQELKNLLWKDRVYFVEIDGFDELMANIHNSTKGSLSLDDSFGDSKKEKIIRSFTDDKFNLKKSSIHILKDLETITKRQKNKDIGGLIAEISRDSEDKFDSEISDDDLKKLLIIDSYIKHENYADAESVIKKLMSEDNEKELQNRFITRLIQVYLLEDKISLAIASADDLIKSDPYNVNFLFRRASLEIDVNDRYSFLLENEMKYEFVYHYYNALASNALALSQEDNGDNKVSFSKMLSYCDKSLRLNPALSNNAWKIKLNIIEEKHKSIECKLNKNDKEKDISSLIEQANNINSNHITKLELAGDSFVLQKDISKLNNFFEECERIYNVSGLHKKESIVDVICSSYMSIEQYCEDDSYKKHLDNLVNSKIIRENINLHSVNMLMCYYYINVEFDLDSARRHIDNVILNSTHGKYINKIIEILLDVYGDSESALIYLNSSKDGLTRTSYLNELFNIYVNQEKFDEAINALNKARDNGMKKSQYAINLSFCHLKSGKYKEAIECCDWWLEKIKDLSNRDILIINREFAKKSLGEKIDRDALNIVVSHKNGNSHLMCANFLLGKETQSKSLFKKDVDHFRLNLYIYNKWPIIPSEYFCQYDDLIRCKRSDVLFIERESKLSA